MSQILDFFADNPEVAGSIAKTIPAIMGMHQANKAKNAIEGPGGYQEKLENLERNRQELVNPYATVSNPYANLQVATKAAEMQADQTDIALANTLDNLRQTGAGGATALAQAALKSKQGVAADIQRQEAQNQKLQAQGQQQMEIAQARGAGFAFKAQEMRDVAQLDRLQGMADIEGARRQQALGTGVGSLTSMASGAVKSFINPEATDFGNGNNESDGANNTNNNSSGGGTSSNQSTTGGSGMNSVSGINSPTPPANMPPPYTGAVWVPGAGWL